MSKMKVKILFPSIEGVKSKDLELSEFELQVLLHSDKIQVDGRFYTIYSKIFDLIEGSYRLDIDLNPPKQ